MGISDNSIGLIDHNSYEKDNETNWLDYEEINLNPSLHKAYKWLINFRLNSPALRKSNPASIRFIHSENAHHLAWIISGTETRDRFDYLIGINAHDSFDFTLGTEATWEVCWSDSPISENSASELSVNKHIVKPKSSFIARKLRK